MWLGGAGLIIVLAIVATNRGRNRLQAAHTAMRGRHTIEDRLAEVGEAARTWWAPHFSAADLAYPPSRVTLVCFKRERVLHVHGANDGSMRHVARFDILGASGTTGPKLREGDRQVPEGIYAIESLNPNSRFHLALRVNYPNADDRARGALDGRTDLGGDIMIHGGSASVGCLAMGDETIERLFVLAADVGVEHVEVLLCPYDLRSESAPVDDRKWVRKRYAALQRYMEELG